jgi:hypothetical protein
LVAQSPELRLKRGQFDSLLENLELFRPRVQLEQDVACFHFPSDGEIGGDDASRNRRLDRRAGPVHFDPRRLGDFIQGDASKTAHKAAQAAAKPMAAAIPAAGNRKPSAPSERSVHEKPVVIGHLDRNRLSD